MDSSELNYLLRENLNSFSRYICKKKLLKLLFGVKMLNYFNDFLSLKKNLF